MKHILSLMLIVFSASMSFNAMATSTSTIAVAQDEKTKIKVEELPQAAQTTLKGDEYKDWTVNEVYSVKSTSTFEVELKKGEETKTVKFDSEGKVVA